MGQDEVGRLTRSFNGMIAKLRQNRELEERVRESQYLSQLGRLSSGLAHEIRNPLNFIGLAIDHLDGLTEGRTPESSAEKAQVTAIMARRAATAQPIPRRLWTGEESIP